MHNVLIYTAFLATTESYPSIAVTFALFRNYKIPERISKGKMTIMQRSFYSYQHVLHSYEESQLEFLNNSTFLNNNVTHTKIASLVQTYSSVSDLIFSS